MRIVYAAPGEKAEVRDVEDSLEAMQSLVGGWLEKLPFLPATKEIDPSAFSFVYPEPLSGERLRVLDAQRSGKFDMILNEEGRLVGLPPNRLINGFDIVGPLFITKGNDEGDWVSLTEDEAAMLADMLNSESDVCRTLKPEEVEEPSFAVTAWEAPK